jgi:hypothetical protein
MEMKLMTQKPLTEVLARTLAAERYKLNPDLSMPWDNMSDAAQDMELGAMHEVVRVLGLFGWEVFEDDEGVGIRRMRVVDETKPKKRKPRTPPVDLDPMGLGAPERAADGVRTAQRMGFTGIPCEACGSVNTVRNGKCLLCMDCKSSGECG